MTASAPFPPLTIRRATEADRETLRELWEEFMGGLPPYPFGRETWDDAWPDVERHVREGVALLAEDGGHVIGFALSDLGRTHTGAARVTDLYVRDHARRRGVGTALLASVAERARERGLTHVVLEVASDNRDAQLVYDRLGFREFERSLYVAAPELEQRAAPRDREPSFGSIHVQSDDESAVRRAVEQFMPRIGRTEGSQVTPPRNGWIAVYDELCDRDRDAQRRLARELSDRLGAVVAALALEEGAVVRCVFFERGRMVDEYLSLPEYYGPLTRADALALAANATLLGRLTGADPGRVRAAARSASSAADLPPPRALLAELASVLGIEGAERGYEPSP